MPTPNDEAPARVGRAIFPEPEGFLCRIANPSQRARVIYDGIKNAKPIHIPPGNTIEPIVLSRARIEQLRAEEFANPEDPDLKVVELGPAREDADHRAQAAPGKAPTTRP